MRLQRRLLLRGSAAFGLAAVAGRLVAQAQPKPRIIPITARRFTFEPAALTLKLNEPVIFSLRTLDVVMGFSIPDFGVRGTILPGRTAEVAMTPTRIGEFTFLCDVFCGAGHEDMDGTLRVVA